MTPWRKVSLASWKPRGDSSTYCLEDLVIDDTLDFCHRTNINFYSLLIKSISNALLEQPKINSTIRWWKIRERKDISVFFHTIVDAATDDLSGIRIEEGQNKSLEAIDQEFKSYVSKAKNGETEYNKSKKIIDRIPSMLVRPLINFQSMIAYGFNQNWSIFKSPPNAFGSIMLTAVGSLGISKAICPIAPYTKVPMVISVGNIEKRATVINDEIKIRKMVTLGFTFDHRIMDGVHFQEFYSVLKGYVLNPKTTEHDQ